MFPEKINSKVSHSTVSVDGSQVGEIFDNVDFQRLPGESDDKLEKNAARTWRIFMVCLSSLHDPLPLEICDEVVIGRQSGSSEIDLDLSSFHALELGVSRLHATLKPTNQELLLFDLDSKNGTYCNFKKITKKDPVKITDKDVISFGGVTFLVQVIEQPKI